MNQTQMNSVPWRPERDTMNGYCTIRVKWNAGDLAEEQLVHPQSLDEVVATLLHVRDRHAYEYAEAIATDTELARSLAGDVLGGFGVEVTNRWGSVIEIGPGRDVWFLFRYVPKPALCHSDHPPINGTREFYLDGGHHTELGANMLVSQEECFPDALRVARQRYTSRETARGAWRNAQRRIMSGFAREIDR